ncbi:MAG: hypothetical protein WBG16_03225 [Bradyrhizobium sp.]|uniref:hypothetical protein n=1 Tax=Bradyrhizobium sp. TaxID=376 RepID=UPI003C6824C4
MPAAAGTAAAMRIFRDKIILSQSHARAAYFKKDIYSSAAIFLFGNKSRPEIVASQKSITTRQYCVTFLVIAVRCASPRCVPATPPKTSRGPEVSG